MTEVPQGDVPWLDEQEQAAWRSILRAGHLIRQEMELALDAHAVSLDSHAVSLGEYELLSMLSEAPGERMRMSQLADLIVQSRSRVSHTATRLQRRGWVERVPALEDGRGVVLELTDPGRERLTALAPVHVGSVRRALLDHLSREELITHGAVMRRVVLAIRHSDDEAADIV